MKWNSIPPDYAAKAIAAKALARKNRSRENLYMLAGFLVAAVAAILILLLDPFFFEKNRRWIALLLAAVGIAAYFVLKTFFPLDACAATCPKCLHDWTIHEGKTVPLADQMLTWDQCPGCGSLMNDGLLQIAIKNQSAAGDTR